MFLKRICLIGAVAAALITNTALAGEVELRLNNKTDRFMLKATEGFIKKDSYEVRPGSTYKEWFWFSKQINNLHVYYKPLNQNDYIEIPYCGGGQTYHDTVTVNLENPLPGNDVPVCSIL